MYELPRTVELIYCIQCSSRDVLFSQYRRYSRAVSATACIRSGQSHRLALVHEAVLFRKRTNYSLLDLLFATILSEQDIPG